MNRRKLLASTGIVLPMIVSGCLESAENPDQPGDGTEDNADDSSSSSETHDEWHLCADVATKPSLAFERSRATGGVDFEGGITHGTDSSDNLYVALLTGESDLDDHEITADNVLVFIDDTDFETEVLLAVQYGITGSSNTPRFMRIEETDDGVHGFGCIRDPYDQTADATVTTSLARFECPDTLETAKATIVTSDGETTVSADDGIMTVNE